MNSWRTNVHIIYIYIYLFHFIPGMADMRTDISKMGGTDDPKLEVFGGCLPSEIDISK